MRKIRTQQEIEAKKAQQTEKRGCKKLMRDLYKHDVKPSGRSLNDPNQEKIEYLERQVKHYKQYDINYSHANIVLKDFGMSVHQFMNKPLTGKFKAKIKGYLYEKRGTYNNNKTVRL